MSQRISYSVHEAAKAAGIGLTKLRQEIRENRLVLESSASAPSSMRKT